uniref:Uncharacterized protein n=1 Tax=Anguilla anguilla TaxID=7936 RepID=A0A0E9SLQ8_ANGAN
MRMRMAGLSGNILDKRTRCLLIIPLRSNDLFRILCQEIIQILH